MEAIVYRHSDGYPSGAGKDLVRFLDECAALADPRFEDPSFLAARYVVFLARLFNRSWSEESGGFVPNESPLDFLSVGICQEDPGDIEYRYVVTCGGEYPDVEVFDVVRKESLGSLQEAIAADS